VSELYSIVQKHMDNFGPSASEIARRIGAAPQTVSSWKARGLRGLPEKRLLVALARLTHTPYGDVLTAALRDCGYLPEEAEQVGATRPAPAAPAVEVVAELNDAGEGTVRGRARSRARDVPRAGAGR
jgi:hypothetical protein